MVQQLGLGIFTSMGSGLILGQGTKIPQDVRKFNVKKTSKEETSPSANSFNQTPSQQWTPLPVMLG